MPKKSRWTNLASVTLVNARRINLELSKDRLLQILVKRGGSVSLYPLIETGHYPVCTELVSEGLATLSGIDKGIGEIEITDKGRQHFEETEGETKGLKDL